jgi:hypothetical protein
MQARCRPVLVQCCGDGWCCFDLIQVTVQGDGPLELQAMGLKFRRLGPARRWARKVGLEPHRGHQNTFTIG